MFLLLPVMLDKKHLGGENVSWFWYFMVYSFFGFLLEVVFARVTRNPKRDRKCFYFLPLCPVYGLGALAMLALPSMVTEQPLLLLLCAGLAATGAEYLMALFYEKVTRVSFWDYSHLPLHIHGRVCLLFSFFWGVLGLLLIRIVHPKIALLVSHIPLGAAIPVIIFLVLDAGLTFYLLRRERTTDVLLWYRHLPVFRYRES